MTFPVINNNHKFNHKQFYFFYITDVGISFGTYDCLIQIVRIAGKFKYRKYDKENTNLYHRIALERIKKGIILESDKERMILTIIKQ
jgi:hypothetical protein